MQNIAVSFDALPSAQAALDWVGDHVSGRACRVVIVSVDPAVAHDGHSDETLDDILAEAVRRVSILAPHADVLARTDRGRPANDALLSATSEADLLVVGAQGRRGARSDVDGWPPFQAVADSPIPVVIIPDRWTHGDGPVLVGIDGPSSQAAVRFGAEAASRAGRGMTVLRAWQMPAATWHGTVTMQRSPAETRAANKRVLDEAVIDLEATHPELAVERVLTRADLSEALLMEARRSSMLVLAGQGDGSTGAVTRDILLEARIPVCVVPASPRLRSEAPRV